MKMDPSWVRSYGLFGVIVSEVFGTTAGAAGLGYWLYKSGHAPAWLAALLAMAGAVLGFWRLLALLNVKKAPKDP